MNIENLLSEISKCLSNNEVKNLNTLHLLEYIRFKIIEKLRSKNNKEIINLINLVEKNNNLKKNIKNEELDLMVMFNFINEEKDEKKTKSSNNVLEIVLGGQKNFLIFDNENNKNYISYKIMPLYGIVYSANTQISYKTIKKTTLLNINMEDKSKKE